MTHCLALRLDEGLVFLADTRTNAGLDNVASAVLDRIQRDLDTGGTGASRRSTCSE